MRVFAFFSSNILIRVLFCCKSDETFAIYVYSKRFKTGDNNVKAKVKFIAIKKKRIINVSRDYTRFSSVDLL